MIFLKLLTSSGRGKDFLKKWIQDKLYLKFGIRSDVKINNIHLVEEEGKIQLVLDINAECSSDDFYDVLEKIAK